MELAKTRGEITVKKIEESMGANRNTIKVHLRKLATDNYLAQVCKDPGEIGDCKRLKFRQPLAELLSNCVGVD